jgi:hypothetical protein
MINCITFQSRKCLHSYSFTKLLIFTLLSEMGVHNIEWTMVGWFWMISLNVYGRMSWPIWRYYPGIRLEKLRTSTRNLSRCSRFLTEIRTWYILNASHSHNHCDNRLGKMVFGWKEESRFDLSFNIAHFCRQMVKGDAHIQIALLSTAVPHAPHRWCPALSGERKCWEELNTPDDVPRSLVQR